MRPCPNYPGYSVTQDGAVVSHFRRVAFRALVIDPTCARPLKMARTKKGYLTVRLAGYGGPQPGVFVHRMVLDAYHGPQPDGAQARHLDGDPSNNRPGNLAWGSPRENAADRQRHGRYARGRTHPMAILTEADVLAIRAARPTGAATVALAEHYGCTRHAIHAAATGRTWRHLPMAAGA